jgi:FMN phosphatase YigB (HAD superfamily)
VEKIEGILFEPVGCLAEFPAEPFQEIAAQLFDRSKKPSTSGSRSYWHLLNLIEAAGMTLNKDQWAMVEDLELQAVAGASVYEDVIPALSELQSMGIQMMIASSLSAVAVARFLESGGLGALFTDIWSRDDAGGMKAIPLERAIRSAAVRAGETMFLTDTAEGVKVAKRVGVNAILMMNDPDDAKRLAMREPAGGIVSLQELPDFIRFVAAKHAARS